MAVSCISGRPVVAFTEYPYEEATELCRVAAVSYQVTFKDGSTYADRRICLDVLIPLKPEHWISHKSTKARMQAIEPFFQDEHIPVIILVKSVDGKEPIVKESIIVSKETIGKAQEDKNRLFDELNLINKGH